MKEILKKFIKDKNEIEAQKILLEYGFRWCVFGAGLGIVVTCIYFNIIKLIYG